MNARVKRLYMNAKHTMLCLFFVPFSVAAKDLGTWGDLWPVEEQSMLSFIQQRLGDMEKSGQLAELQQGFKERVVENTLRPPPVAGLRTDTRAHTHRVDPSVSISEDMADHNGTVFARKGQRINPLDTVSLPGPLYFLDADDKRQTDWLVQQPAVLNRKVILVSGNIRDATKRLGTRIYFDQNGDLSRRFGLTYIPAVVRQEGKTLVVTSVAMPEVAP
ncbi:IncF plasmid conjugative transfer pilus assembly protein TraW [Salmonella enterica]|nr:IncF plasmid conjugative transfer pilus assembly protein TraW [Salmonella enterica]